MRLQATSQRARDKNRGILSSLGGRALCLRLKRRVRRLCCEDNENVQTTDDAGPYITIRKIRSCL